MNIISKTRHKLWHFSLAAALLLTLSACGTTTEVAESDPAVQITFANEEHPKAESSDVPLPSAPSSSDKLTFEPNPDLNVIEAFVYEDDTYVVVENTGAQPILNYSVAFINFDKNGFSTTTDSNGFKRGEADAANIISGAKDISSWYGSNGSYAVAAVVGIEYADGTTWDAPEEEIAAWAEENRNPFDIEAQKARIAELKEIGTLAETNEYAILSNFSIQHDNRYSSEHDFHFSIENTSNQGITKLALYVLEFDENGFPVPVDPYDVYCSNGHVTGGNLNLAPGKSGSYSDSLFISPTTTQLKVIITNIEFQDGSEWENPYLYEWIIGNNRAY